MANNITYIGSVTSDEPLNLAMAGQTDPESTSTIKRPPDNVIMVFQYITCGRGFFINGGNKYIPVAGDFFIVPPHRAHHYYPDPHDPWGKVWINVTGNLPIDLMRIYGIADQYYFPGCHEAGKIVEEMVYAVADISSEKLTEYVSHRILDIIMVLSRFSRQNKLDRQLQNEKALKLRDFLRSRIATESPGIKEMSKKVGLSPVQTIRVFRDEFNITPYAYLLNEKINVAAEMLSTAENSIKEIAELLGFTNEYYFSRIFKQKKGIPPGTFRRNAHSHDTSGQ